MEIIRENMDIHIINTHLSACYFHEFLLFKSLKIILAFSLCSHQTIPKTMYDMYIHIICRLTLFYPH